MTAQIGSGDSVFFDLSDRVKLRLHGRDCVRFLNGQLTNDIRKASESKAIEACVLNAKGKMDAHLFARAEGDSFVLDADAALAPVLQARLERYIIADDVVVDDVTARFSLFHVLTEDGPKITTEARIFALNRFGRPGHDIWVDAQMRDQVFTELSRTLTFCDDDCAEIYRIERGIPRWGRELTNEIIPVEANLEERCIDYEKGCYIGQEIVSRMKMSGQRNKELRGLVSPDNVPMNPGARLASSGREAGWITSAACATGDRQIALAYVKRGFNAPGASLEIVGPQGSRTQAHVVALPFSELPQP